MTALLFFLGSPHSVLPYTVLFSHSFFLFFSMTRISRFVLCVVGLNETYPQEKTAQILSLIQPFTEVLMCPRKHEGTVLFLEIVLQSYQIFSPFFFSLQPNISRTIFRMNRKKRFIDSKIHYTVKKSPKES